MKANGTVCSEKAASDKCMCLCTRVTRAKGETKAVIETQLWEAHSV